MDHQQLALTNLDDGTIQFYSSARVVSERVKAALAEVVKQRQALEAVAAQLHERHQQVRDIGEDQARIRQNMAQLDRNTDVYKNYVKKLSEQETEIEKLRGQIAKLNDESTRLRKALDDYLLGLDLQ
jgi:chromosome segregation ATPase